MPRFCANLDFLFTEHAFLDRFGAARAAGFEAVEILFPYDHDPQEIAARLDDEGLHLALINTPAPDWAEGGRGSAALPGQTARFRAEFAAARDLAARLDAEHIHILAGIAQGGAAQDSYLQNLAWAADNAPDQPLTIEPINPHDMPGYFLNAFDRAAEILKTLARPNLHLQFDAYHAQRIAGDVPTLWADYAHLTAHVQVAGHPGRHEPAGGDIDYPAFFTALDAGGYAGWVSGEYHPATRTEDGLGWCALPQTAAPEG
ncbi:hydroxypyruvate isomerase family protein [Rhodovulum adriaticum]|uniref:Hydroxypyruvate isomerase n=1 Tax=Rhodovulum adriaticum TaxID=35804 RepID=A0A4R2NN35_RHOAD|nr:TIM barrel protein [Rhodovulum adriaticum]MBK1636828.1 hydroxypyruvate isomerase [Rhodovulum adriaticum]TCP22715.1 hydroxypyruvate isomerase [Rhodovulum adriaticum]